MLSWQRTYIYGAVFGSNTTRPNILQIQIDEFHLLEQRFSKEFVAKQ